MVTYSENMSVSTMLALGFLFLVGITLLVPSFPPAQLLCEFLKIPPTSVSAVGISVANLLSGFINGFFWILVAAMLYGVVQYSKRAKPLPPMPVAPQLETPALEATVVDERWSRIPPSITVPQIRVPSASSHSATGIKEPVGVEQDVETIDGIGPVCGGLLRNSGIKTVNDLLKAGADEKGRRSLASEVGVSYLTLLKWVYRADLLRVRGVDAKYSSLLESAGVNTVTDLATRNPLYLSQTLRIVNKEKRLVRRRIPACETIEGWVNEAKKLTPVVS